MLNLLACSQFANDFRKLNTIYKNHGKLKLQQSKCLKSINILLELNLTNFG